MSLILKSDNALQAYVPNINSTSYINRVIADGGQIIDQASLDSAFEFAGVNGITAAQAFSVTAADWGIKFSGGKPYKLYSLFGASGDIVVSAGDPRWIGYDDTSYSDPVVVLAKEDTNALQTFGTASNVISSGLCIIAKSPNASLLGQVNTGTTGIFALGDLSVATDSANTTDSANKRMQTLVFEKKNSETPDLWTTYATGYNISGLIKPTAAQLVDATKWSSAATYLTNGEMELYSAGQLVLGDSTVTATTFTDNLSFNIGRSKNGGFAITAWNSPMYGIVAEAWCLVNTTKAQMKAVSLRASQLYPN